MGNTPSNLPLGCVPIDSAQSLRKAWDNCALGHRVVPINVEWNIIEREYNSCCQVSVVSYYYENQAESTRVQFTADCCSSLCNNSFVLFGRNNCIKLSVLYSVDCGTAKPVDTDNIKYVLVDIKSNDPKEVVTLATYQALTTNAVPIANFCVSQLDGDKLIITNLDNGDAHDTVDNGTCFTFTTLTQGTKTLVESYTYTYDTNGKVISLESSSGKNIMNLDSPIPQSVTISGSGRDVRVSKYNELAVEMSPIQESLLEKIHTQLKIANFHLSLMTDEDIRKEDL